MICNVPWLFSLFTHGFVKEMKGRADIIIVQMCIDDAICKLTTILLGYDSVLMEESEKIHKRFAKNGKWVSYCLK